MHALEILGLTPTVAPLTGSEGRNMLSPHSEHGPQIVAPLTGSEGRNAYTRNRLQTAVVAPLTGSEGRNSQHRKLGYDVLVAPLTGSEGRNAKALAILYRLISSLPSRGARVEISPGKW